MSGWPTTRRYSRTLQQAFPQDYANAVEVYRHPLRLADLFRAVICVIACVAIGVMLAQGFVPV